jgi:pyridoxamine 5'-phosphate oxidase
MSTMPNPDLPIAGTAIADLRRDYRRSELLEAHAPSDPLVLFDQWFAQAQQAQVPEPNAMTLATINAQGFPSARIVLLKGREQDSFSFFTNYQSDKGQELAANPHCALVFLWDELERQVRIEGIATRLPAAQSDAYFLSRPLGSRIGAWASPQSQVIHSRADIEQRYTDMAERLGDSPSRPEHWGGYSVSPTMIEFWQGRSSRLHDRLRFERSGEGWHRQRLAP